MDNEFAKYAILLSINNKGTLNGIADNYPKCVISLSPMVKRNVVDGIIHLGLREFLSNGL